MKRPFHSALFHLLTQPLTVAGVFVVVNVLVGLGGIGRFGYDATTGDPWLWATRGELPFPATYSPLPTLLTRGWQAVWGTSLLSAFAFKATLFGGAVAALWHTGRRLFDSRAVAAGGVYLTLLAPYLVWSVYVAGDTHFDLAGVALLLWVAAAVYRGDRRRRALLALGLTGALAATLREPNVVLLPALLALLVWRRRLAPTAAGGALAAFAVGLAPLLAWNTAGTGALTLSARLGQNLYYGNHPFYLAAHPHYDLDVFIEARALAEYTARFGPPTDVVTVNANYTRLALTALRADPAAAVQRAVLKTVWWLGVVRIPAGDALAFLAPDSDTVTVLTRSSALKEVVYSAQRLLVWGCLLWGWRAGRGDGDAAWLLWLPTLALLPVVLATFPDTRFRLALDPAVHLLAAAALREGWRGGWIRPNPAPPSPPSMLQ